MTVQSMHSLPVQLPGRDHRPVLILYNIDPSWPDSDINEIEGMIKTLKIGMQNIGHIVQTLRLEGNNLSGEMAAFDPTRLIVLNWCEEIPGVPYSCALVADELEKLGFTYTGADASALQFSLDKPAVKRILERHKIPIPTWRIVKSDQDIHWNKFPAIVKPAYEHSSVGITREAVVQNQQELVTQVSHVLTHHKQPALVEDFIDGREFHATVIGNGRLHVLPIAEMDFSGIEDAGGRLCTYDSKFNPTSRDYQMIQLRLPAVLSESEQRKLEEVAIHAYLATGCRDYARLDIRLRDDTFYVLDVNPNADISPDTSSILSAGLVGYSFEEFCSLLVHLASHRHPVHGGDRIITTHQEQIDTVFQPAFLETEVEKE